MKFNNYNFQNFIMNTLNSLNFSDLTLVQEKTIPELLKNRNVIVQAETGSGKTLAYLLPTLNKIDYDNKKLQAIIFIPTRDLSLQLKKVLFDFKKNNDKLNFHNIIGGNSNLNDNFLGSQILIGSPSKIKKLYDNGKIKLNNVKNIIFDEFDMMYELGFLNDINFLLMKIKNNKLVNFSAFSATISQEIEIFFKKNINNVKFINLVTKENKSNKNITHYLIPTKHQSTTLVLKKMLKNLKPYICLIFVNKKTKIDEIYDFLIENNYKACKIHGEMQTRLRKQTIKKITNLEYQFIVSTDLLSRGIDIEGISHVISIDLPNDLNYYIHRSGRTGRYDQMGYSYLLSDHDNLEEINKLKSLGIKFTNLFWNNENFVEKEANKFNIKKKNNSKNKYDYTKDLIYNNNSEIKPGYKKKRSKILKKLKNKRK